MNSKSRTATASPSIRVARSTVYPYRWVFYINGERRGSAPTRAQARQAAEELIALAEKNRTAP